MHTPAQLRLVKVRGAMGATALARVVEQRDGVYYVAPESDYQEALSRGETVEARLGFPESDVDLD